MKTIRIVAATLAALAVAACSDSTGNTNQEAASGSLSFTYAGARNGSYSAEGIFKVVNDSTLVKQSFAAGLKANSNGVIAMGLISYIPTNTTVGTELFIIFQGVTGSASIDLDPNTCNANCPLGLLAFETDPNASEDDSQLFFFTGGHLNVTNSGNGRLTGTFNGTAENLAGDSVVTITNGTFDVPLLTESGVPTTNRMVPSPAFMPSKARRAIGVR